MTEADNAQARPGSVRVTAESGVGTIDFSHPKSNSLPGYLLQELAEKFDTLGRDHEINVIVLRSEGTGTFCAGASFEELKAISTEQEGKEFFSGFARVILAMRRCPKFIIARVHGKTVGGGIGLVAAADYSFALPSASAKLSELALGIGPFVVGPAIERRIGRSAFNDMAIDAEWRDADWCQKHGLYSRVLDTQAALDSVLPAMAGRLALNSPAAMRQLKRVLWEGTDHWETLLPERAAISGRLVLSEYTRRAIQAFEMQAVSGEVRAARLA